MLKKISFFWLFYAFCAIMTLRNLNTILGLVFCNIEDMSRYLFICNIDYIYNFIYMTYTYVIYLISFILHRSMFLAFFVCEA